MFNRTNTETLQTAADALTEFSAAAHVMAEEGDLNPHLLKELDYLQVQMRRALDARFQSPLPSQPNRSVDQNEAQGSWWS